MLGHLTGGVLLDHELEVALFFMLADGSVGPDHGLTLVVQKGLRV